MVLLKSHNIYSNMVLDNQNIGISWLNTDEIPFFIKFYAIEVISVLQYDLNCVESDLTMFDASPTLHMRLKLNRA